MKMFVDKAPNKYKKPPVVPFTNYACSGPIGRWFFSPPNPPSAITIASRLAFCLSVASWKCTTTSSPKRPLISSRDKPLVWGRFLVSFAFALRILHAQLTSGNQKQIITMLTNVRHTKIKQYFHWILARAVGPASTYTKVDRKVPTMDQAIPWDRMWVGKISLQQT